MKDPAIQSNRLQCLFALVSASIVVVCVCAGVTMNLVTIYDVNFDHMGIRTFCMFTVDSNILAGLSMMLCIPYCVDGLRTGNYQLPDWVVVFMHIAVTSVTLTFLVSLFILSPVKGFVLIFTGSRFFLHGVCPILCIITYCFYINSHLIRFKEAWLALVPVGVYAIVYMVMVIFIGEQKGGWNDFYGFATRVPIWFSIILIVSLTIAIIFLLRYFHNKTCLRRRGKDADIYRHAYGDADIKEIIKSIALSHKRELRVSNVQIPSQMLGHLLRNKNSDLDLTEACRLYLEAYLKEE